MERAARKKVIVIDDGYGSYDIERRILDAAGADVIVSPCKGNAAAVLDATQYASAVLVRESPVGAEAIAAMQCCEVIVRYGIGVDNVDMQAARARRIHVANVPDYGIEEVSDQAVAMLLAIARRIVPRDAAVRRGAWNVSRQEKMYRIAGRVLGLVGYGRIARKVEQKMRGFGVTRVLAFDPFVRPEDAPSDVEFVALDRLCAESDYVSVHSPLTPQTRGMLDARTLGLMQPTTILVNTARGGLLDETALMTMLREGRLFGAGLDVFETEPPLPGSAVLSCPNLIVSDHTAWYSEASVAELQEKAANEVLRVFQGDVPRNWLNRWD